MGHWAQDAPSAAAEQAAFLAETAASGALGRLVGSRGPSPRLDALVRGAEDLPFDEAGRKAWLDALMAWLVG